MSNNNCSLFYDPDKTPGALIAQIEKELVSAGFGKVDPTTLRCAARSIIGQKVTSKENDEDVKTLISFYREMKIKEFLENRYAQLPPPEKLTCVKYILEESEFRLLQTNLGRVFTSTGNIATSALVKAYEDAADSLKTYARSFLKNIFLASPSPLNTPENIRIFMDEYIQLQKFPQPYQVIEEKLKETSTVLKSFMYDVSGNVYVFCYPKNGKVMHTVIDTGARKYMPFLLQILSNNGVDPANIETVLLTHHHVDHSGLIDIVCLASGATALMHHDFQEEHIDTDGAGYIGRDSTESVNEPIDIDFGVPKFHKFIKRLPPVNECATRNIGGIEFPVLEKSLPIGEDAGLEILGLPLSGNLTHAVDQLFFLYTPKNSPATLRRIGSNFRPTDEILFSGDLWLMHSPGYPEKTMSSYKINALITERKRRVDFRPENRAEKNALKLGFNLIRVKPGHGPEFLGSRMINNLLSTRDIRVKLGFSENDKGADINAARWVAPVKQLREKTYQSFLIELRLWLGSLEKGGFGYSTDQASKLLQQIYQQQIGGGELVGEDRQERRKDLIHKLTQLLNDQAQSEQLHSLARTTIALIASV